MRTQRKNTLKIRDLVTGKTMTVEEWKRLRDGVAERVREDMATDEARAYGPWHTQQNATHGDRA